MLTSSPPQAVSQKSKTWAEVLVPRCWATLGEAAVRVLGYPVWSRDKERRAKNRTAAASKGNSAKEAARRGRKLGRGHERCQDRAPAAAGGQVADLE